jgi:hypothetical protein
MINNITIHNTNHPCHHQNIVVSMTGATNGSGTANLSGAFESASGV